PLSISTSLALIYAGARGRTEAEIGKAAHFNLSQENLQKGFGQVLDRLNQVQRWNRITLRMANALWCDQRQGFSTAFINAARRAYQADARVVYSCRESARASRSINTFVNGKTGGRIQAGIQPKQLTPDTSLVLCNAIYFKGKWAAPFDRGRTRPE